jgi:hypothetical protein
LLSYLQIHLELSLPIKPALPVYGKVPDEDLLADEGKQEVDHDDKDQAESVVEGDILGLDEEKVGAPFGI